MNRLEDPKSKQTFSITELCHEFGITARALRFYEQRQLLAPERHGEARAYTHRDKTRLKLIMRGKQYGFTLSEIKWMLDLYEPGGDNSKQLHAVLPRLKGQLHRLEREKVDLEAAIAELSHSCEQIAQQLND